jgi:hypothetical protein
MKIGPDNSHVSIGEILYANGTATVVEGLAIGFQQAALAKRKIDVLHLVLPDYQTVTVPIDQPGKSLGRDAPNQVRAGPTRHYEALAALRKPSRLKNVSFQTVRNSG